MKDERKELIDFFKWIDVNYALGMLTNNVEECVDEYLKSINSSPCERKVDSNNEQTQKVCNIAFCKEKVHKAYMCKGHYKQKYGSL